MDKNVTDPQAGISDVFITDVNNSYQYCDRFFFKCFLDLNQNCVWIDVSDITTVGVQYVTINLLILMSTVKYNGCVWLKVGVVMDVMLMLLVVWPAAGFKQTLHPYC